MKKEINGLILFDQEIGEKDRIVTVLTSSMGVIRCFTRGARQYTNPNFAHTQALNYSSLNIFFGRKSNTVDDARIIRSFFEIRNDLNRLAAAQYLCELVSKVVPEGSSSGEQLDLMLNCLHLLSKGERPHQLIKAVGEIRMCVNAGMPPQLLYCAGCGKYEDDMMFFDPEGNGLYCSSCAGKVRIRLPLNRGALTAFRYIVLSEPKKAFSFTVSKESMSMLSECAERYVLSAFDVRLRSLDYYKQLLTMFTEDDPEGTPPAS